MIRLFFVVGCALARPPTISAFSVGFGNGRPRIPSSHNFAAARGGVDNSSSQLDQSHRSNGHDLINDLQQFRGLLRRGDASLAVLMVSALAAFAPSSVAHDKQTYASDVSWSSSIAIAAESPSSITPSSIADLGLMPPTEDKPQIKLNDGKAPTTKQPSVSQKANGRQPILQGLVYFPERASRDPDAKSPAGPQVKQQLDYYSDILVLTAVAADRPDGPTLAGAKFPVSSVRFPFSFTMYKENLLDQNAWSRVADTGDVVLRANICPSDASAFPCAQEETKKNAQGVAKLITNLPGLPEGEKIRAPASLALQ
ncbi:hypothetical protein ACHAXT_004500 [Thalassiosira profunda]